MADWEEDSNMCPRRQACGLDESVGVRIHNLVDSVAVASGLGRGLSGDIEVVVNCSAKKRVKIIPLRLRN